MTLAVRIISLVMLVLLLGCASQIVQTSQPVKRKRKRNNPKNRRCQRSPIALDLITTEPNDLIQPIHNRMPAILQPEDEEQWLDASRTPFTKAKSLLKALSRRADECCSRRFANRQLGEV